jgi:hypothetical protein
MRFRLIVAAFGVVAAMVGNVGHTPALFVAGIVGCVPLAVKVLAVPARARGAFALTAVVAGLLLAGFAAGHHSPTDRPVPAACVTGVTR